MLLENRKINVELLTALIYLITVMKDFTKKLLFNTNPASIIVYEEQKW